MDCLLNCWWRTICIEPKISFLIGYNWKVVSIGSSLFFLDKLDKIKRGKQWLEVFQSLIACHLRKTIFTTQCRINDLPKSWFSCNQKGGNQNSITTIPKDHTFKFALLFCLIYPHYCSEVSKVKRKLSESKRIISVLLRSASFAIFLYLSKYEFIVIFQVFLRLHVFFDPYLLAMALIKMDT